jgi:hypothetical protein
MPSNALIGIAGVHYVASELSRRDLVALPTTRNTAGYDIIVVTADGKRHANIQVKASSKRAAFFPMPATEKVRAGPNDYYVLVRWLSLSKEKRFEGFMLSGRKARQEVQRGVRLQKRRIREGKRKGLNPSISVGPRNGKRASQWRHTWQTWTL